MCICAYDLLLFERYEILSISKHEKFTKLIITVVELLRFQSCEETF